MSPIHQRKQILPPHGKGINAKIMNSVYRSGSGSRSGGCSL